MLSMTISIRQSAAQFICQTELKCRGISAGAFESFDKGRVIYQALPGSTLNPSFRDQTTSREQEDVLQISLLSSSVCLTSLRQQLKIAK